MEIRVRNRRVAKIETTKFTLDYSGDLSPVKYLREIEIPENIFLVREAIEEHIKAVLEQSGMSDKLGIWWIEEQSIKTTVYDPEDLVKRENPDLPKTVPFDDEPTPVPGIVTSEDYVQNDELGNWPSSWYDWSTD